MNGAFPQTIESPYFCGLEAGREHFAHQPIVLGIKRYHLNIMADILHQVGFAIVTGKRQANETPRHFNALYFVRER